jgi:hypothetical protein
LLLHACTALACQVQVQVLHGHYIIIMNLPRSCPSHGPCHGHGKESTKDHVLELE